MAAQAQPITLPSPSGGMNTREGLAALQPNEARLLRNWIPVGSAVEPRKGYDEQSTGGIAGVVATLFAFNGLTASQLIGINGAGGAADVIDFSSASAASVTNSNYTVNRWQVAVYNNRAIGVNGTDTPFVYDGSATGATGFTGSGLTITNLVNVAKVRNRLWFCENNSADVWYGGIGSITGTLTKFQLSQVVGGGTCMAIGYHSQDAGDGPDDITVFVMSTGEVVAYSGDPGSTFAKIGNFNMPAPVGRKCLVNIGGQLAVLTRMGLVPLTAAFQGTAFDILAIGPFGKIAPSLQEDVRLYGALAGWEMVFHNGVVIINVPTLSGAASRQWWFVAATGAWTQTDYPAACFASWAGDLYFGSWSVGTVYKVTGYNDVDDSISLIARTAFSPDIGRRVFASLIRFDMVVNGQLSGRFGIDADFGFASIDTPVVAIAESVASTPWGSVWGSQWSSSNQYQGQWFGAWGEGRRLGVALEADALTTTCQWYATTILGEAGSIL